MAEKNEKTAYIIYSNYREDWAEIIKYPGAVDFNAWSLGFMAASKKYNANTVVMNVVSQEEIDSGCSSVSKSERDTVAAL